MNVHEDRGILCDYAPYPGIIRRVTWWRCHVFSAASLKLLLRSWERRGSQSKDIPLYEKTAVTDFGRNGCTQSYRASKCPRSICPKTLGLRAFMRLVSQSIFDVWMHLPGITFSCISTFLEASMQYLSTKRSKPWHFRDSENPQIEQNELAREVLEKMRSGLEFLRNDGFGTSLENG